MIDALLATLQRDAEAEIARVLADARTQAAVLAAQAEERIAHRRQATLARRKAEGRAASERALAGARHAARKRVLDARAALLDRVFAELRAALPAVAATGGYRAALARDVARALVFAGDQKAIVRCAPALAAVLRGLVETNGRLSVKPDPGIAAGFLVATADGGLEVDATLEGRALRLRPRLALEALAALRAGA